MGEADQILKQCLLGMHTQKWVGRKGGEGRERGRRREGDRQAGRHMIWHTAVSPSLVPRFPGLGVYTLTHRPCCHSGIRELEECVLVRLGYGGRCSKTAQ